MCCRFENFWTPATTNAPKHAERAEIVEVCPAPRSPLVTPCQISHAALARAPSPWRFGRMQSRPWKGSPVKIAFAYNLKKSDDENEAEFDTPETVDAIAGWLRDLGHDVDCIDVGTSASRLCAQLEESAPDLVFNTAEGHFGRAREAFFPALYEQLKLPYTGSDAYVCTVTLDKHLTKQRVAEAGVPVPRGFLVQDFAGFTPPGDLVFPVFMKPNFEGSSKGIDALSKADDVGAMMSRLQGLLKRFPDGVIVESFVPGDDVAVGFLEAMPDSGGILPPILYKFEGKNGPNQIYDYALKNHDSDSVQVQEGQLSSTLTQKIKDIAAKAFAALGVRDIGRIDFRVTPTGEIYFLEVNALPSLEPGAGIYLAAKSAGLGDERRLLDTILRSASARWNLNAKTLLKRKKSRRARVGLAFNLKRSTSEVEAEFDAPSTIDAISTAIASHGYDVVPLEANADFPSLVKSSGVDVVFNIAEGIGGRGREAQVPAVLELFGIPCTGSDAATLSATLDKSMAKSLVRDAGLLTPAFQLMTTGKERLAKNLTFPLVVKPAYEGSSKGIGGSPIAHDEKRLRELAQGIAERFHQPALVEQFLPGREFTFGMLGAHRPRVLSPMEIRFQKDAGEFPTYNLDAKKAEQSLVVCQCPAEVDEALLASLHKLVKGCWAALGCRDVSRIDVRLDAAGRPAFIECNPLPGLAPGYSDLCVIAEASGLKFNELVREILTPALKRWRRKMSGEKAIESAAHAE